MEEPIVTNRGAHAGIVVTAKAAISAALSLLLLFGTAQSLQAEPTAANLAAFDLYTRTVEARLAEQHRSTAAFLGGPVSDREIDRLRKGELIVQDLRKGAEGRDEEKPGPSTTAELNGAILCHWRGTAFAPGATASAFEGLLRNYGAYPRYFSPQVLEAKVLAGNADHMQAWMRVRQHHVLTVVLDTSYDVSFGRLDQRHGYSIARSTRIVEIGSPGTAAERPLGATQEHGFLWRQNTYWSYEERDGGVYLQIESVSLTRSIPAGLGWAVRPYVESIPRESLEFTLRAACNATQKPQH